MTYIQRPSTHDDESRPANDNNARVPEVLSVLDLIPSPDDDKIADIVRRTERLAIALVIGMAICLIAAPIVYVTLTYYSY
ncbi:hypothetical protein ACFSQQ_19605 [Mesorhizobium kowhaii]|uniref:Uncharacterized protein n=1 Tax=Mesorhizobium kowhaii TaxID=1300272 RepID=A0A2W7C9X8_9HYPH|nr:hypothetical protein [Mesorhizobium kowhaii]PZV39734.1 hypothetical protein B5V02_07320 [Mesorhizobium kowhaii]